MCSFWVVGCAEQDKVSLKNVNIQIFIDETGTEKVEIPAPNSKKESKKIILPYLDSLNDKKELLAADLSFCGLKNAKIMGYDIGTITSAQTLLNRVQYNFSADFQDKIKMSEAEEKQVLGNCLVLLVSAKVERDEDEIYIVVLDYINGKHYISKTIVENYGDWLPELHISDVTNDGLDDIIITNYRNVRNTGMVCEVLRFYNNSLNSIYQSEKLNEENDSITRSAYFKGRLEDKYKLVIEASNVGFKKSISLLDLGYQSKDLEAKGIYDNKKIDKSINKALYISPLDNEKGLQIIKKSKMKSVVRLMYRIYMPNRVDYIGKAYAYMNYDNTTDTMKVTGASVDFAKSTELP